MRDQKMLVLVILYNPTKSRWHRV